MNKKNVLLITGGTGTLGKTMLVGLLKQNTYDEIRVFSRDELKQDDLRKELNSNKVKFFIGDIRDEKAVRYVVNGVNHIVHAAALKQVPSCEYFPSEAIKTNVLGTENLLRAAEEFGVQKVVSLSTDKAVYPVNAMGMSKALMEKVILARTMNVNSAKTIFCIVRFGNVACTRGSVIPFFVDLLRKNQPLPITHPKMTRYIMSQKDALELCTHALQVGKSGEIFVHKSPASTILMLAETLSEIFQVKNNIKYIGTRHGEKLIETLVNKEEKPRAISKGKYFIIQPDLRDLLYNKSKVDSKVEEDFTSTNTKQLSKAELKKFLLTLDIVKSR